MLWEMFTTFFKIGSFTFGGGFAMIPIIQEEIVEKKSWISEEDFLDTISIAQSSPGPIAVNTSIFVGYRIKGLKGALVCTLGAVLPSFIIMLVIAMSFSKIRDSSILEKIFSGIRPAVVALIFSAVYTISCRSHFHRKGLFVAFIAMLIIVFLNINPIYLILTGAIGSIILNKFGIN